MTQRILDVLEREGVVITEDAIRMIKKQPRR
jgi:hypothetical protein